MPNVRKASASIHLFIGLILGGYFALLGLTGSVLVFKSEIGQASQPELYRVAVPANQHRLPYDELVRKFEQLHPGSGHIGFNLPQEPEDSIAFGYLPSDPAGHKGPPSNPYLLVGLEEGQGRHDFHNVFMNPYTGTVLGDEVIGGPFFYTVHNLHANLLLEGYGTTFQRAGILFLLALELSGLLLWLPKSKNFWQQVKVRSSIKFGASLKRVTFDVHNAIGIYSLILLLPIMLTATAVLWPQAANGALRTIFPTQHQPAEAATPLRQPSTVTPSVDRILQAASTALPALQPLSVSASSTSANVTMGIPADHSISPRLTNVSIDPSTYAVKHVVCVARDPIAKRIGDWVQFVHYGQWGYGFAFEMIKVLWCMAGLCPAILFVSGWMIYRNKQRGKTATANRRNASPTGLLPARG